MLSPQWGITLYYQVVDGGQGGSSASGHEGHHGLRVRGLVVVVATSTMVTDRGSVRVAVVTNTASSSSRSTTTTTTSYYYYYYYYY